MDNLIIRNVEVDDLDSVADIIVKGWQTAYKGIIDDDYLASMNKDTIREKRKEDYQEGSFIVAELNKEIVGFTRYYDDNRYSIDYPVDCELMAIYVKPELKYQGIGTKMFNYVIKDFKSKNKKRMVIWCLKDNYPSRKFYEKMGGILIGEKEFIKVGNSYPEVGYLYELDKKE